MNCNLKMLLAAATLGAASVRAVSLSAQAYLESMLDNGKKLKCMRKKECNEVYKKFVHDETCNSGNSIVETLSDGRTKCTNGEEEWYEG